jgi:lysophospholipase L1-like esterase
MAFRRAVRWTAASTLGVGALAGAQAFACHAWYEALPDATGPTRGVAIPRTVVHDVAEWREGGAVGQGARRLAAMRDMGRDLLVVRRKDGSALQSSSTRSGDEQNDRWSSYASGFASARERRAWDTESRAGPKERAARVEGHGARHSSVDGSIRGEGDDRGGAKEAKRAADVKMYVIGDSLVTGVGASDEAFGFGPVLPRVLAERLADITGLTIEWRSFGKKAADVRAIREEVVPLARAAHRDLSDEKENAAAFPSRGAEIAEIIASDERDLKPKPLSASKQRSFTQPPDVVVLLCGVNDFKHAFGGRTPEAFRRELRSAVRDVRAAFAAVDDETKNVEMSDDFVIVLPGMPMQLVTAFPPPLSLAAVAAGDAWDEQKRRVAAEDSGEDALFSGDAGPRFSERVAEKSKNKKRTTVFVPKPSAAFMRSVFGDRARLTAEDGVHPNEWGYAAWAHHIAGEVAEVLRARRREEKEREEKERGERGDEA